MSTAKQEQKPVVLVVNKGYHDYKPAERFGKLEFMSTSPDGISQFHTSTMARLFQPYIDQSLPSDYILVTGYTVMVSVLSAMFSSKHHRLNLLIYKPGKDDYEVRRIEFRESSEQQQ